MQENECARRQFSCLIVLFSGAVVDPLDDVFAAMRVHSAVYARLEARAPWGLSLAGGPSARFGLVVRGRCLLVAEGAQTPLQLTAGDCYVLARGEPYVLCDELQTPRVRCTDVVRDRIGGVVELGGTGSNNGASESATVICGWFTFDALGARPLMALMPPLLHVRMDAPRTELLQATLGLLAMETESPGLGSGLVVSRLADIVFVQAIRAHVAAGDEANTGWMSALSDRRLGGVLRSMHKELGRPWTIDELAGMASMSRSAFAACFKRRVGEAPMDYLARWRMFRAGCMLRQSQQAVGEIAAQVGYESEAAFSKAFKRVTGLPPGEHRRRSGDSAPVVRADHT
jgi:AraC-like DNA-binding protein